jgi:hypothetical protein
MTVSQKIMRKDRFNKTKNYRFITKVIEYKKDDICRPKILVLSWNMKDLQLIKHFKIPCFGG